MNMIVSAAAMASATTAVTASPIEKPSADAALEMEEKIFQHKEAAEVIYPEMNQLGVIWQGEMQRLYEAAVVAGNVVETEAQRFAQVAPCRNVLSTSD